MKAIIIELLPNNGRTPSLFFSLVILFLTFITISLLNDVRLRFPSHSNSTRSSNAIDNRKCDLFNGRWVHQNVSSFEPYYTNSTCRDIYDQVNCMKFGRPDSDFLRWRWKPDGCDHELPKFDAGLFLELMRNKSLAFVGDSVGRNQLQSLICLLSQIAYPVDQSQNYPTDAINSRRLFYTEYNFTLAMLGAPYLVKVREDTPKGNERSLDSMMRLDLDRASQSWATQIEDFDYVIISAGTWFFRTLVFHLNDSPVSCHKCELANNITNVDQYYGIKMAFQTTFKAILELEKYKGVTILRTFSPAHFENGDWDKGGNCPRTKPYADDEPRLGGYVLETYKSQVTEFTAAKEIAKGRGLDFRLLDTTRAMSMRGDGHPNHYGHSPTANASIADCVHWCLPGPIDTWNELLQELIRKDGEISIYQVTKRGQN